MRSGPFKSADPSHIAVIAASSEKVLRYAELDEQSNKIASYLRQLGLNNGDTIAVCLENRVEYFALVWAGLRSGLMVTPINKYLSAEEIEYIVSNSESKVLFCSETYHSIAYEIALNCNSCSHVFSVDGSFRGVKSLQESLKNSEDNKTDWDIRGNLFCYSSATTGRPKGIELPLSLDSYQEKKEDMTAALAAISMGQETVYLCPAPLYHAAPIQYSTALQELGATIVVMEKFDAKKALDCIERYKVTFSQWVPTMFVRMLKLPEPERLQYDISSQTFVLHAAAPCPVDVKKAMLDWWGPIIYEYYGGSERNGSTYVTPQEWLSNPGTVGKAHMGTIRICNEAGEELPAGEVGRIYFDLPDVSFEYKGDLKKTKEARHPVHPTWTTLDDVGYVNEEGYLFLTGRFSHMIISGGVNIYPQEIEDCLCMFPGVEDVAVIGVPHDEMGEEVKAVVELSDGYSPSAELEQRIIAYASHAMARFKCPKSVDFVDKLPRLETGKLAKRELYKQYWPDK